MFVLDIYRLAQAYYTPRIPSEYKTMYCEVRLVVGWFVRVGLVWFAFTKLCEKATHISTGTRTFINIPMAWLDTQGDRTGALVVAKQHSTSQGRKESNSQTRTLADSRRDPRNIDFASILFAHVTGFVIPK